MELKKAPGELARARGQVRASGFGASTYTVRKGAVLTLKDGVKGLIYGDANGGVYFLLSPTPAYVDADYGL